MTTNDEADDVATDEATDPLADVLASIEEAAPLVRAAVRRGEQIDGSLSVAMLAIKALATVCNTVIKIDENAFLASVAALHNSGDAAC